MEWQEFPFKQNMLNTMSDLIPELTKIKENDSLLDFDTFEEKMISLNLCSKIFKQKLFVLSIVTFLYQEPGSLLIELISIFM